MSGGVAFVLDEAGDFPRRCNLGMVDLEPLVDPEDIELVRDLLIQHAGYTGSTVAARILADWAAAQPRSSRSCRWTTAASWPRCSSAQEDRRSPGSEAVMARGPRLSRLGKPTGFLEFPRDTQPYRPVAERLHDYREVIHPWPVREARRRRGRAAWTAASRSATRAARSAT